MSLPSESAGQSVGGVLRSMTGSERFGVEFAALTTEGHDRSPPFRWQTRLFRRFVVGDLPEAVDVPTGLGKTSVMALWLIALAFGANLPRRLVYVVDRRAVVDQATRFAERLRLNMPAELAGRLELKDGRLPISILRGGFADNRDWLEDPSRPAIVVGTIDMIGSRLLFEGYGVSRGMRPYHAGFLGVDTLVLLDEAHLCPPFEALLRQIASHRDGKLGPGSGSEPIAPPFHLMSLSATGRELVEVHAASVFRLEKEDREEPTVHQRLTARKRLSVTELEDARQLVECIARRAIELGYADPPSRVLVYCHRRTDAVAVEELIDKEGKRRKKDGDLEDDHESELLVGERRVYERTGLEAWLDNNGFLGGSRTPPQAPTFLVATSAGEVGVDLDADHMVCDLVAHERMVQRIGRVNRRGGEGRSARVDVFAVRPARKSNDRDTGKGGFDKGIATYEQRLAPLLRLLRGEDGCRDASPSATVELKLGHPDVVEAATTPAPLYPELTRPLVDAWSMTSLRRHEGRPEVAPWLRGWEDEEEAQTDVVWRKYLPSVRADADTSVPPAMVADFFRVAPIHATERLEAASGRVLDWLLRRTSQVAKRGPDHDMAITDDEVVAILLDRTGEHVSSAKFSELRHLAAPAKGMSRSEKRVRDRRKQDWRNRFLPGALLVVDARMGGLRDGTLDEKSEFGVAAADADESWRAEKEDPSAERSRPLIRFRVAEVTGAGEEEGLEAAAEHEDWRRVRTFETRFDGGGVARHGLAVYKWPDEVADEDSRSILSAPQTLDAHAEEAAARAREMAARLGLPDEEIDAISIAARLHDEGKAAARWQDAMNAPKNGRPYAKTSGGGNWRLLEGYRHEFGSLLMAERSELPECTRDLILHLIAAHHGNARPLVSSAGCEDGPPSLLESRAGDAALRFARLQRLYGPWGLAWREAILRAADQSVSREWSMRHRKPAGG